MEERKLNLNAPLLSVRRISTAKSSSNGENAKKNVISLQNSRRTRTAPMRKPEVCLDQVTEHVAVPFVWEKIPGKCKDSVSLELQPSEEGSVMPRLPPGRVIDTMKYPLEKEVIGQSVSKHQTERCVQNDHETKSDHRNGGDEMYGLEYENGEEVFSDALETLSQTSLNYSVSMLSGSNRELVKPSGTFSSDVQTRDFMMSRFLPAAKAMTLEPPQYSSRKQPMAVEEPREVNKMIVKEVTPPQNHCQAIIVPHYELKNEQETADEEEDSECDVTRNNISRKACGLLPRLCFKNSLCLLNPLPGLKVGAHSSKPSRGETRKPSKAASKQSQSQMIKQNSSHQHPKLPEIRVKPFYAANQLTKSGELPVTNRPQSPYLLGIRNKPLYTANRLTKSRELQITNRALSPKLPETRKPLYSDSRLTKSSELQIRNGALSPKLPQMRNKALHSDNRLTQSGELQITNRAQSPKLAEMRNRPLYSESQLTKSGELQIANSSSPSRLSVSGRISPYRRERPQSPFKGGGLLGFPKEGENPRTSILNKYDWTSIRSYSHELVSHRSLKQGSDSGSPAVEKTLYVDTGKSIEASSSSPYSSSADMVSSVVKDSETVSGTRGVNKLVSPQSPLADVKCSNAMLKDETILEQRTSWPVVPYQSYPEVKNRDVDEREAKEADYEPAPLPPPLPKVPSESWLWRTLRHSEAQGGTKKQDPKTPAATTKWETIVKTSYQHHDHVRYSEELPSHVSKQQKK